MQPHLYTTDSAKIAFLISLLMGRALQWAETIWSQAGTVTLSFDNFIAHFREVFGRPAGDTSVSEQLYHLRQGVNDYALKFRTLAAASGWNECLLLTTYWQGLEPRVRLQLTAYDNSYGLECFIQLSIRCATRMQSYIEEHQLSPFTPFLRRPDTISPPEPDHEPMLWIVLDSIHRNVRDG